MASCFPGTPSDLFSSALPCVPQEAGLQGHLAAVLTFGFPWGLAKERPRQVVRGKRGTPSFAGLVRGIRRSCQVSQSLSPVQVSLSPTPL